MRRAVPTAPSAALHGRPSRIGNPRYCRGRRVPRAPGSCRDPAGILPGSCRGPAGVLPDSLAQLPNRRSGLPLPSRRRPAIAERSPCLADSPGPVTRPGYYTHLAILGRKSRSLGWPRPFPSHCPAHSSSGDAALPSVSLRDHVPPTGTARDRQRPHRCSRPPPALLGHLPSVCAGKATGVGTASASPAQPAPREPWGTVRPPAAPRGLLNPAAAEGPRGPWRAARVGGSAAPSRSGRRGRCRGYADERLRSQAFPAPSASHLASVAAGAHVRDTLLPAGLVAPAPSGPCPGERPERAPAFGASRTRARRSPLLPRGLRRRPGPLGPCGSGRERNTGLARAVRAGTESRGPDEAEEQSLPREQPLRVVAAVGPPEKAHGGTGGGRAGSVTVVRRQLLPGRGRSTRATEPTPPGPETAPRVGGRVRGPGTWRHRAVGAAAGGSVGAAGLQRPPWKTGSEAARGAAAGLRAGAEARQLSPVPAIPCPGPPNAPATGVLLRTGIDRGRVGKAGAPQGSESRSPTVGGEKQDTRPVRPRRSPQPRRSPRLTPRPGASAVPPRASRGQAAPEPRRTGHRARGQRPPRGSSAPPLRPRTAPPALSAPLDRAARAELRPAEHPALVAPSSAGERAVPVGNRGKYPAASRECAQTDCADAHASAGTARLCGESPAPPFPHAETPLALPSSARFCPSHDRGPAALPGTACLCTGRDRRGWQRGAGGGSRRPVGEEVQRARPLKPGAVNLDGAVPHTPRTAPNPARSKAFATNPSGQRCCGRGHGPRRRRGTAALGPLLRLSFPAGSLGVTVRSRPSKRGVSGAIPGAQSRVPAGAGGAAAARGTDPRPRRSRAPRGRVLPLPARGPAPDARCYLPRTGQGPRAAVGPGAARGADRGTEQPGPRSSATLGSQDRSPPPRPAGARRDPGPRRPRHRPPRGARSRPPRAPPRFGGRGGPAGPGHYLTSRRRITVAQRYAAHQWSSNVSKFEEG
ncbi:collagen alpha-1(I) chain-like [Cinclus cinclus]|uniref:collagen alpha-1(I) chain-like n=1 Tax=Cinclus cinclus TaxID=127875 RepID=UPI002E12C24C